MGNALTLQPRLLTAGQRFARLVRMLRPANSLSTAALVLLGARLADAGPLPDRAWRAALAMWLIATFGYVSNDWFDRVEDAVNKPFRALPSGAVSPGSAAVLAGLSAFAGVITAGTLGWLALAAAIAVLALLMLYNIRLKATAGVGNLLIAVLAGCTLVTGAVAASGPLAAPVVRVIPASLLLILFVAAREIIKTLQDMAGDARAGKHTIAACLGSRTTLLLVATLAVASAAAALAGVVAQGYSPVYLAVALAGVVAPLFVTVAVLWPDSARSRVNRCLNLLKASYLFGLLALLLA